MDRVTGGTLLPIAKNRRTVHSRLSTFRVTEQKLHSKTSGTFSELQSQKSTKDASVLGNAASRVIQLQPFEMDKNIALHEELNVLEIGHIHFLPRLPFRIFSLFQ